MCFSSAEQCPSATGSHNSLPVCAQRTSTPHPALAISFSSSGPGPLPHLHPIVWAKAARAGLGPVQTYSSLSLDDCQYSLKSVNFVTLQIHLTVAFCRWNKRNYALLPTKKNIIFIFFLCVYVACWDSFMHVCRCNKIPIHHAVPKVGQASVCLSPSPVRKEGWSVFSGRTPFGWGSAPPYWPLCGSLIELSCQRAARSQCRVHYVIQTHSGAPREVLGSADNGTAPSSNTQKSVASLSPTVRVGIRKTPDFNHLKKKKKKNPLFIAPEWRTLWKTPVWLFCLRWKLNISYYKSKHVLSGDSVLNIYPPFVFKVASFVINTDRYPSLVRVFAPLWAIVNVFVFCFFCARERRLVTKEPCSGVQNQL